MILKREDLNHTGSHKINNVLGQTLLAKRMGKTRIVAETGAGQHGVASATAAALMGLECKVYMGAVDVERQALNVFRMRLLGAEVEAVESGSRTLKDAVNEAMRDWVATVGHSAYCLGSVMGPHPYPWMVRQFHRVIGEEASEQCAALLGGDPDLVVACVGGGSNAMGIFTGFVDGDGPPRSAWSRPGERRSAVAIRASCTACAATSCKTRSARSRRRSRSRPGSTIRASVRSTRISRRSAGPSTRASPTPR